MRKIKKQLDIKLGSDNNKREEIFQVIIVLLFFVLGSRMAYLQAFNQEKYSVLSERNRIKEKSIPSPRGKIFDRNGEMIATNGAGYRLVYLNERNMDPEKIREIAEMTGHEESFIEKRIKYGEIFPYTKENVILENLDMEKAHKLMEKIVDYPYLEVQTYYRRNYELDSTAAHTIGYVKKISKEEFEKLKNDGYTQRDIVGKDGIEKFYDKDLKGKDGHELIEVNAFSKIQTRGGKKQEPIPGKDLHITIDMKLQRYMEEEFRKGNYSGSFIALNPKNGEVIAIVSYPTYSLNLFSSQMSEEDWASIRDNPQRPLSNKSIAGEYPPGSTFKVVSALAFLREKVDPNRRFQDKGGVYVKGNQRWRAWKAGGHGSVDMKKSLIESANPYYYEIADKIVGWDPIHETAEALGLDDVTKIDVPGERRGSVPARKEKKKAAWRPGDTINGAIGQGYVTVTPIQLAMVYSAIANKGEIYRPHVGKKLVSYKKIEKEENGKKIITYEEEPTEILGEKVIIDKEKYPKKYYDLINDALIATVSQNNGTTKALRTEGVKVAAKSGSAQNAHSKITHAWVGGYFPADNPEIVFVAILEGAGGGGAVAGAMAKKFVDKYYEFKNGSDNQSNNEVSSLDS